MNREDETHWRYLDLMAGSPIRPLSPRLLQQDLDLPEGTEGLPGLEYLPGAVELLDGGDQPRETLERLVREAARGFNRSSDPEGDYLEDLEGQRHYDPKETLPGRIKKDHARITKAAEKLHKALMAADPQSIEALARVEGFDPEWLQAAGHLADYSSSVAEFYGPIKEIPGPKVDMAQRHLVMDAQKLLILVGKPHGCTVKREGDDFYGPVAALALELHKVATGRRLKPNWILDQTEKLGAWRNRYLPHWDEWSALYPAVLHAGDAEGMCRAEELAAAMDQMRIDWASLTRP